MLVCLVLVRSRMSNRQRRGESYGPIISTTMVSLCFRGNVDFRKGWPTDCIQSYQAITGLGQDRILKLCMYVLGRNGSCCINPSYAGSNGLSRGLVGSQAATPANHALIHRHASFPGLGVRDQSRQWS